MLKIFSLKKVNWLEIVLITSNTMLLKRARPQPKPTMHFFRQKLLSEKLRDLRDAIGHFVFRCHHVTYRTPCHASDHLVIYGECYEFERACFTLRHFLIYTPSCWF